MSSQAPADLGQQEHEGDEGGGDHEPAERVNHVPPPIGSALSAIATAVAAHAAAHAVWVLRASRRHAASTK